jgi:uncharacterized membrane protein
MSAYDFMWNAAQSGQISELEKRIEKLEEQNQILYEWVQYFKQQLKEQTNGQS